MSDMKLIMEGWRSYCTEPVGTGADFDLLYENYSKGRISHTQLYEGWDRQVSNDAQVLLEEGVLDALKVGFEKGKQLAGKAKEVYDSAVQKVIGFVFQLELQAWKLLEAGKIILSKIAAVLMKAVKFIKKFCGVHPVICKATLALVVMISITAVMAMMASPAMAGITSPEVDGEQVRQITDTGVNAIKGCLEVVGEQADSQTQQLTVDAFKWLEQAQAADTMSSLGEVQSNAQAMVASCFKSVQAAAEEDPGVVKTLASLGEQVKVYVNSIQIDTSGATESTKIVWKSLSVPGKGNISSLVPGG